MAETEWAMFMPGTNRPYDIDTKGLKGMFSDIPSWMSMLRMCTGHTQVAVMNMTLDNGKVSHPKVIPKELKRPSSTYDNPLG